MNYTGLTDERNEWRRQLESDGALDIYVLQQYRLNRNSDLWRSTREVEKLCETILFLEGAKPMSETVVVKCDMCGADITDSTLESSHRIRLIEEVRYGNSFPTPPELTGVKNFCNLSHLHEWIMQ